MICLKIKKILKQLNLFELIWIISVIILLTFFLIFFPDLMFDNKQNLLLVICSIISVIASPIVELLISKQNRYWTIFSLFFVEITDIVILFSEKLYTSALISLLFWIPFDIMTYINWTKHKDEEISQLTKVKCFKWWIDILIVLGLILLSLLYAQVLINIPNQSQPYIASFSNIFEIANGVFLLTRRNEQWLAWFGYLICEIVIWVSLGHYIMLITVFAMMINTIYGFVKWLLYIKNKKITNCG